MQDKDFDNIFNHKFGQLPGEPYHEEGWSDLSGRLDMHKRSRRRWLLPVLLPLFGLLSASNAFWWYQWREATRPIETMLGRTTVLHTDTIVRTTVVVRYDTIYRYVSFAGRAGWSSTTPQAPPDASRPDNDPVVGKSPASGNPMTGILPGQPKTPALQQERDSLQKRQHTHDDAAAPGHTIVRRTPADTSARDAQASLTTAATAAADSLFEQPVQMLPKLPRPPLIYLARPRLNVSAGWGSPSLPHKRSGSVFGMGIGADAEVARRIRLGIEASYLRGSLKADETDALRGVDIPDPGNDFKLRYWETYRLPAVTYALHLRYEIPAKKNWTPWIGAGIQAVTVLPFEIEFEFENQTNNLELYLPAQSRAVTHWQGYRLMLGAEGRIGRRITLGAEGFLLRRFDRQPSLLDRQMGITTRFFYTF